MSEKDEVLQTIKFDNKGWDIAFDKLYFPKNLQLFKNSSTELIERDDKKYCCLFYLVGEYRMLCYTGLICVFKDKNEPKVIFSSEQWFEYQFTQSVYYCGNYIVLRKREMYFEESKQSYSPFIIIDLENLVFSILDFDFTAAYYGVDYSGTNKLKLRLNNPDDLKSLKVNIQNLDGKIIDLAESTFFPLSQFDNEIKKYCDVKKAAAHNTLSREGRTWWQKVFNLE